MSTSLQKTVLLVEDSPTLTRIYEEYVRQDGYQFILAETGLKAIDELNERAPSVVVIDLDTRNIDSTRIIEHAHKLYPQLPVVTLTSNGSIDYAVEAMIKGAYDFIRKPFPAPRLTYTLRKALEHKELVKEVTELRRSIGQVTFHGMVGQSPIMQSVYRLIDCVAPSRAHVFIHGEYGTGKEMAARTIHTASQRRNKPFVSLNCASTSRDMIESSLFGAEQPVNGPSRNVMDGAIKTTQGGTLFLDEICEMPIETQDKLLRHLQIHKMKTPQGNLEITTNIRVIATTTRDPPEEIRKGRFNDDLYCCLRIISMDMPPLRDRNDDILLLSNHFLAKFNELENRNFSSFAPDVLSLFRSYDWPGNVRQLQSVIRNVVVLHDGTIVTKDMLPKDLKQFAEESKLPANENAYDLLLEDVEKLGPIKPLWIAEKDAILQALDFTAQDIAQAATLLEVSPSTLYRKLQMWRLEYTVEPHKLTGTSGLH